MNVLKTMTRQSANATDKRGAQISAKKLIQMRNQGMLKNQQLLQQQALKPLYSTVQTIIKQLDSA